MMTTGSLASPAVRFSMSASAVTVVNVKTVLSSQVTAGHVMAMDSSAAKFYASNVAIAFDPYTEFSKNRTFVRAELYGVCAVSQGFGVVDLVLN